MFFNNSSCDNVVSLACCWLLYSNYELLGRTASKREGKDPVFWSLNEIQISTSNIVLHLLIGQHLILFLLKKLFPEISWDLYLLNKIKTLFQVS